MYARAVFEQKTNQQGSARESATRFLEKDSKKSFRNALSPRRHHQMPSTALIGNNEHILVSGARYSSSSGHSGSGYLSRQYLPEKRRQQMLDPEPNSEHVFIYTANNSCHVQNNTGRGMPSRRVHLIRTATPVFAPVMENGVEPVVPARADLVLGYLEVLLAPEVHATVGTNRGGARQD